MDGSPDTLIGERVRFFRQAGHKTQAVVSGLVGITEDYLSQIERGLKTPTVTTLHRLAGVLGVPTSALLGEPPAAAGTQQHSGGSDIHAALTIPEQAPTDVDLAALRSRIDHAWRMWQSSPTRYSGASTALPALTREVEAMIRLVANGSDAGARREAWRLAADLYFLLRTYTKRIGRPDLARLVADRGIRAAEEADDPGRLAAARWNLGQVLLSVNEADVAEDVAIRAVRDLQNESAGYGRDSMALGGALWLVAVVAAVRRGDAWVARDRLKDQAYPAAQQAGDGNVFWTVFGPTNVRLHSVSIELETGESSQALHLADKVRIRRCPSIERRATFALDLARCFEQRHDDNGMLVHLLSAESEAPEDLQFNPLARDLVRGLMRRARPSVAPQVHGLAERLRLFT